MRKMIKEVGNWIGLNHGKTIHKKRVSNYGELDLMSEHKEKLAFKGQIEHIARLNIINIAYPCQHIDIVIPDDSRNHAIVPYTIKII